MGKKWKSLRGPSGLLFSQHTWVSTESYWGACVCANWLQMELKWQRRVQPCWWWHNFQSCWLSRPGRLSGLGLSPSSSTLGTTNPLGLIVRGNGAGQLGSVRISLVPHANAGLLSHLRSVKVPSRPSVGKNSLLFHHKVSQAGYWVFWLSLSAIQTPLTWKNPSSCWILRL